MPKPAKNFFNNIQKDTIRQAIMNAELDTSGEIRVHIENECPGEVMERAAFVFNKLNMHKTNKRNGVLFYLALRHRKFAIIGDLGINAVVPEKFWDNIKEQLIEKFVEGDFCNGLADAITQTGLQLKKHFPFQSDDENELNDELSFGEN
ncbi:MAG: TPM domain-containing protein [Bacteroidales bacterium]|nr:TPM domain-containing protein [Bacteroidales bacterium]MDD2323475.1 TPM domain-containing protein [Bacteroidales bacterium]MDD3012056.1 TPM domain-containing protein [Bacteroidales bacterium]MDY0285045.1 TPM domain-containing protein [Bacteroidales bacterium]